MKDDMSRRWTIKDGWEKKREGREREREESWLKT